jgi:hypothetical protein
MANAEGCNDAKYRVIYNDYTDIILCRRCDIHAISTVSIRTIRVALSVSVRSIRCDYNYVTVISPMCIHKYMRDVYAYCHAHYTSPSFGVFFGSTEKDDKLVIKNMEK